MIIIPERYEPVLDSYETQKAIGLIKQIFQEKLCSALWLRRVTAPLIVDPASGMNDNLNGVERPVEFDIPCIGGTAQVVQSLAKWKRHALKQYGFHPGRGLVTDMNAIRRDEELDNLHSVYVDQWDWERVILKEERTIDFLKQTVTRIVTAICSTMEELKWQFDDLQTELCRNVTFITSQELLDLYPDIESASKRENEFTKKHKTVFVLKIGKPLSNGKPHDGRAPDYDDWDLNGDLLFWNDVLQCAFEVSSMGIRVDDKAMDRQLSAAGCDDRRELPFHKQVLAGQMPYSIGGGIGQSRLCLLLLGKAHIGEVQSSIWDEANMEACRKAGIPLL